MRWTARRAGAGRTAGGVRQARALPYVMRDPGREPLARRGIARRAPVVVAPRTAARAQVRAAVPPLVCARRSLFGRHV